MLVVLNKEGGASILVMQNIESQLLLWLPVGYGDSDLFMFLGDLKNNPDRVKKRKKPLQP